MTVSDKVQNISASQRIANLEYAITQVIDANQSMVMEQQALRQELEDLKEVNRALLALFDDKKEITSENLNMVMVAIREEKLSLQVKSLVDQGLLIAKEEVEAESFVVASEEKENGDLVNPRIQFTVDKVGSEELKTDLVGKKVGDKLTVKDSENFLVIKEIYLPVKE